MSVLQGDELENYVNTGFSKQQLASSARPTQHAYSRHNTAIARLVHKVDFSISSFPFPISSFLLLERPHVYSRIFKRNGKWKMEIGMSGMGFRTNANYHCTNGNWNEEMGNGKWEMRKRK